MEPKEPSPTHPNRTEHKQEPPTLSRRRPRLPTEQKEEPPKRPRGRPPLTIEQKEERKQLRLANVSQEQKQEQRARHAASQRQRLANLSPEDQVEQRARHAASQQQSLANLSPEDQEEQRARHAASQHTATLHHIKNHHRSWKKQHCSHSSNQFDTIQYKITFHFFKTSISSQISICYDHK